MVVWVTLVVCCVCVPPVGVAVSEVVREAGVVGVWMGVLMELEERAVERVAEWVAAIVKRPGLRR